jgi:hypothetical protein
MYYMFSIRQILVSTIVFAAVPPAVLHAASDTVQYVGGTVKSIPVNSSGWFNFDDAKELRFRYNGSVYRLPYDQITGTEIEKADVKHVMHVIPAQSLIFSHRKRNLVINYTDPSGATGTLNFELAAYLAADAQQTIVSKKIAPTVAVDPAWWGDKMWKTLRNKSEWDAQAAQNAAAAQSAQNTAAPVQPGQLAPGGTK